MDNNIHLGKSLLRRSQNKISGGFLTIEDETYYKISNIDQMPDFFMTIVSHSDHWMYLSSNGSLTAGRKNRDNALFPYYTVDKIHEGKGKTGSKTIILIEKEGKTYLWEPFSDNSLLFYNVSRNLSKSILGNKIIFEEINHDFDLIFQYGWASSEAFGWIKKSVIKNSAKAPVKVRILDGIGNILPYGINYAFQNEFSVLSNAYKKNELLEKSNLALFTLSSIPVDRAEPSESLRATTVWSTGLDDHTKYLVSGKQLNDFVKGREIQNEYDVRAEKGAYYTIADYVLRESTETSWHFALEINQDITDVVNLESLIMSEANLSELIENDIDKGSESLRKIVGIADGIQGSGDLLSVARHFSNSLFNIMRGGVFESNYNIDPADFQEYLKQSNLKVFQQYADELISIKGISSKEDLISRSMQLADPDLLRLSLEYLPLSFSRRHGDPSRPWNKFSIDLKNGDGSKKLNYEGNWRDIFQNWEALAYSFPDFVESMICKFLNASTADGYNPYRIMREGIEWESPDPHDPWAYIGYWGDHQIIYLQKLLEISSSFHPGKLNEWENADIFVFSNVPYRIRPFEELTENPQDTITFDYDLNKSLQKHFESTGSDGKLLRNNQGEIVRANLIEKILVTLLAKLSNFIPEAGIWLNTQRPEWNDANNALVGNGVSMVTLYYLRRFITHWKDQLETTDDSTEFSVALEIKTHLDTTFICFKENSSNLESGFSDEKRYSVTRMLGQAGASYRNTIYKFGYSGQKLPLTKSQLIGFLNISLQYIDQSIAKNRRMDGLFHSYNLISFGKEKIKIRPLYEMLEGQVAVLSSGYLSPKASVEVLDALKKSKLFREDQYSYLLYPDRILPRFTEKNNIPPGEMKRSKLFKKLIEFENQTILKKDNKGNYHFNGNFRNAIELETALDQLDDSFGDIVEKEKGLILEIFEKMFDHQSFTGRSGTFFGYEGLGSIYWHMVSKLLLATQECFFLALENNTDGDICGRIRSHYYEIKAGIGWYKSPELYGAFPTDAYSHTPENAGVKQPGLTGQVKEDVISRFLEVGIFVENGCLVFRTSLFSMDELLRNSQRFQFYDVAGEKHCIELEENQFAYTFCQIPVIYNFGDKEKLIIDKTNGESIVLEEMHLNGELSRSVFERKGEIKQISCTFNAADMYMNEMN